MSSVPVTIAVAGVGHLGRYLCEELLASPHFKIAVLTRQVSKTYAGLLALSGWASRHSVAELSSRVASGLMVEG